MPKTNPMNAEALIFAAVMHDGTVRRCCRFNITDWHEANLVITYDPDGTSFVVGKNRYGQTDYVLSELDEVEYLIQDTLEQMPGRRETR